ncbi:MAG: exonuclease SbcCD subunit D [Actinomycetota bacterium]|nr:exonuclease SbcCD subunit D [Acidimicrobiia bacterium]MDQ3293885.1 exonuclease SbcCD subunit D [Actinomycetota bacterium]
MKVLHTSDWHLGARLGRHDRTPDHLEALRGLLEVVESQRPDLVLHTGDLFDVSRPSHEAMSLAVQALRRLSAAAPTVVLCGNHDSAALLSVLHDLAGIAEPRTLWFVTEPQVLRFDVGDAAVAVACVPFVGPSAIADVARGETGSFEGTYADGIKGLNETLLDEAEAAVGTQGVVLYAAHLHVHGAQPARSEKRISVGDDYATHLTGLHRAVYAAFGHIHDAQLLPGGTTTGRYAGSLIPIDFGEQAQTKQCVVVDIGGDVVVGTHDLPGGRPLTRIEGDIDALLARAAQGGLDGHLLKARIVSDDPIPDLVDQLLAASPSCWIFDLVNVVRSRPTRAVVVDAELGEEPSLASLFGEWREKGANAAQRRAPDAEVLALFDAALGAGGDHVPDLGAVPVVAAATTALDILTVG